MLLCLLGLFCVQETLLSRQNEGMVYTKLYLPDHFHLKDQVFVDIPLTVMKYLKNIQAPTPET